MNQYNDKFNQIYLTEESISNNKRKNLEEKLNVFNTIKSYYEEAYNFISNNSNRQDICKDKLNLLLSHIGDYNQNYNHNNKKNINLDYFANIHKYSNNRMGNDYN